MTLPESEIKKAEELCANVPRGFDFITFARDFIPRACAALREMIKLGEEKCPVENGTPDPCPLCGATEATGVCGAGNPAALIQKHRAEAAEATIKILKEELREERAADGQFGAGA